MADLPIGIFDHRVIFIGKDAYVIGGRKVDGTLTNRRTWKVTGGNKTPIEVGSLAADHVATNNAQGMAVLRNNNIIQAIGNGNLAQSCVELFDPSTGLWADGPIWAGSGFYGTSPVPANNWGVGNYLWAPFGDVYSSTEHIIVGKTGVIYSTAWAGGPISYTRPFREVIFAEGINVWIAGGANGVGAPRLLRLDTSASDYPFFTGYSGFMDASWGGQWGSYAYLEKSVLYLGDHLVMGGQENNAGASDKVWRINVFNPLVPVVVACAPMPRKRRHHTSHELNNGLVAVIGGVDETGAVLDQVDLYYPDMDTWYVGPPIPYGAVCKHSSAKSPTTGNILCVGGNTNFLNNACSPGISYLQSDGFSWIEGE